MSNPLPAPAPRVNPESKRFWEATAEGRLLLRQCKDCETIIYYPRALCPECASFNTDWIEASGNGEIYSFTVNHRGDGPYKDSAPFVVAYVELDEGPRMMTNIVDTDPSSVEVGQRVRVVFHDTGEGSALPRFSPA